MYEFSNDLRLGKLGYLEKITKMLGIDDKCPDINSKGKF